MRGYPHYINTPRYAGLYSRDIIAMVAGGEGDGGGVSSHTVSVCSYNQISGLAVIFRENIGRHTYSVVLNFFVERTDFTKSQMSTKK